MQRDKGANGERELCALLTDWLGFVVKRNLGQARDSGHDITLPGFHIECKRRARLGYLYDWMAQAASNADQTPAVAMRADGEGWLVMLRGGGFIRLAREEIVKGDCNGSTD